MGCHTEVNRIHRDLPVSGHATLAKHFAASRCLGPCHRGDHRAEGGQAFSYIDVRGTEMATNASMERSLQSPPVTPRRTRWMAWQSRSDGANSSASTPSAGKKRAHEAVDLDENVATENRAAGKRRAHEAVDSDENIATENTESLF
jgi:hypothetical protein